MIAFPTSPEGGYEAVTVEARQWWEFPGLRFVAGAALAFGLAVAVIQFWSVHP